MNTHESLLQPLHIRAFGVVIDDVARRHPVKDGKPGGQCIHVGTDKLPLHFDGWKCYFHIRKPSQAELKSLPMYELTTPHPYQPQSSLNTRRLQKGYAKVGVNEWQKRLGFPTFETTKATLDVTTKMVYILQAKRI